MHNVLSALTITSSMQMCTLMNNVRNEIIQITIPQSNNWDLGIIGL